jgi:basic membrane protein A and related proteins
MRFRLRGLVPAICAASAFLLVFAAGGCRSHENDHSGAEFKVALLTPGPVSDAGWNASAFDGLQLIKKDLGADTAMVQTQSPADFEDAMRDFASRGFSIVFAHGFEYTDTALKVAKLFPHTWFIVTSGSGSAANVASISFKIEQAAYVEGVVAGVMSKSGVVGAIGGIELPAVRLTFEGFQRGFQSVRPGGRVLISYTGSFDDVGAAKEAALAQVSQGADFLFHNADAAGLGVFQAARQSHIYAFGANRNQNDVAPETVLCSAVTHIAKAFFRVATEIKEGRFKPGMIEYGMKDGMVDVVYNPRLISKIPPQALAKAKSAEEAIVAGTITFPTLPAVRE